jgi:DNA replication and repair protein RecF
LIVYETITRNQDNDIEENFRNEIDNVKEHELRRGTNLVGPHRDDFVFFINGMELQKYRFQGQHKTFNSITIRQFFYKKIDLANTGMLM